MGQTSAERASMARGWHRPAPGHFRASSTAPSFRQSHRTSTHSRERVDTHIAETRHLAADSSRLLHASGRQGRAWFVVLAGGSPPFPQVYDSALIHARGMTMEGNVGMASLPKGSLSQERVGVLPPHTPARKNGCSVSGRIFVYSGSSNRASWTQALRQVLGW